MASNNEAKIRFTAETKEFQSNLKDAKDEIKTLNSELKLNAAEMRNTGESAELLEKRHELLTQKLEANIQQQEALSGKIEAATSIYGEDSEEVANLERQLTAAQTAQQNIEADISNVNDRLDAQAESVSYAEIGIEDVQKTASKITELIAGRISPSPRYDLDTIREKDGVTCIDVDIKGGPAYPYYYVHESTKEAYVRHGDQSVKATDIELNNLILKGQNRTFDSLPSSLQLSDVSFTLLGATLKQETGTALDIPKELISMGLLTEDDQVTNAGLLLSDQGALKQSKIVCTRWKGTTKGSVEGDALDDQEYTDSCLITLLTNAEAFIRNNSRKPWTIRGMRREENSDYPFKAVREVLVNALIHRDYQIVGTEVHVDIFDDRLEISSPGGMMNGSRIQDLDLYHVPSIRRNEIISDIFSRLNLMERRGSGIGRILNSYSGLNEQPVFMSNEFFFMVSLPNRSVATSAQMKFTVDEDATFDEKAQLSTEKAQLLDPEAQLSTEKAQLSWDTDDWELKYFHEVVIKKLGNSFRENNLSKIEELFSRYRYTYSFNRSNVAELFGVSENRASVILKTCVELEVIIKQKNGVYSFVKK